MTSTNSAVKAKNVSKPKSLVKLFFTNPTGVVSSLFIALYVLWALFPTFFMTHDPKFADFSASFAPPSWKHLLGTDLIGHDLYSVVVAAAGPSLSGAAICLTVSILVGTICGVFAGYYGGVIDVVFNWFTTAIMTLPVMIILMSVAAIIGPQTVPIMMVFGLIMSPVFFQLTVITVRGVKRELYVDAAKVAGLTDSRIMFRHILPAVRAPLMVQAGFIAAVSVTVQSALQFLGIGDSSALSWGQMLNTAYVDILARPEQIILPIVVLAGIMIPLILASNTLRDLLESSARVTRSSVKKAESNVQIPAVVDPITHGIDTNAKRPVLEIENLAIGYPSAQGEMKVVVSNASIRIGQGEVVGLVGESGSGKTQTAFATLGTLSPGGRILNGSIKFDGQEIQDFSYEKYAKIRGNGIAYIPQEPMSGLDPSFTVGSQLVEPLRIKKKISKAAAKAEVLDWLAKVGMRDPKKTFKSYPHEVSGGQAQRILIAGALSLEPKLIIADEPTTALDVTVQAEILDVLRNLQSETGVSILLVTHNFGVVADICDRVVIMQNGAILEEGATEEIFDDARHSYTRSLLGSILDDSIEPREPYAYSNADASEVKPIAEFKNVEVTYRGRGLGKSGFKALKNVSLDIRPGETVGLVGESGSGKTTLGRALLGLATVTSGSIEFDGKSIIGLDKAERRKIANQVQVVFQDPFTSLNPFMTIADILCEPLLAQGQTKEQALTRVSSLLEAVALPSDAGYRYAREFSGGQRQRIAIARALAVNPRLIVCDEPVSALDLSTSAIILDLFKEIQERTGVAYLFISHDLSVVRHLSHRIAVMYQGEIVEWGEGDQVTSKPAHPYTQKLLMAAPVADPAVQAEKRAKRAEFLKSEL